MKFRLLLTVTVLDVFASQQGKKAWFGKATGIAMREGSGEGIQIWDWRDDSFLWPFPLWLSKVSKPKQEILFLHRVSVL